MIVRALFAQMLDTGAFDLEAIAKVSTLLGVRRQGLLALGLDRVELEVDELEKHVAAFDAAQTPATAAPRANGSPLEPSIAEPAIAAQNATQESAE